MNPNDNNPTSPMGSGGAMGGTSPIPSPLDFTGGSSSSGSGLSMADSLASAQDNLTSAGQAANTGMSAALGLDQLGANNPSATMEAPNQPLTPAAPVPGSIGSVTSVPPLKTADTTSTFGSTSTTPSMGGSFGGSATSPSTSGFGGTATTPSTSSAMPVMGGGSASSSSSTSATPASSSAYYNPFATSGTSTTGISAGAGSGSTMNSNMPTSTAVPPALQPQTEKFSDRMKNAKTPKMPGAKSSIGNILMIVAWALAIVATILAVFFFIQWQDAEKRAAEKQIVYVPSQDPDDPAEKRVMSIDCKQDMGTEGTEGLENVLSHDRGVVVAYNEDGEPDNLKMISWVDNFTFASPEAGQAAKPHFDDVATGVVNWAGELGIPSSAATAVSVGDSVLHYVVTMQPEQLMGEYATTVGLAPREDGTVDLNPAAVKQTYEAMGFSCTEDTK